jgi:hypothetical protein
LQWGQTKRTTATPPDQAMGWVRQGFPSLSAVSEHGVQGPAAADMRVGLAAVFQEYLVAATALLQGIGQDGHVLKGAILVNDLGHLSHTVIVAVQPAGLDGR